jgi:hypothetical protein
MAAFECLRRIELDRRVRLLGVRVTELSESGQDANSAGRYVDTLL